MCMLLQIVSVCRKINACQVHQFVIDPPVSLQPPSGLCSMELVTKSSLVMKNFKYQSMVQHWQQCGKS